MSDDVKALGQIRRLYFQATPGTIQRDLTRAVALFKSLPDDDTRARAAVFMDGLSQLRSEWAMAKRQPGGRPKSRAATARTRRSCRG